jgi:hypothetical protein
VSYPSLGALLPIAEVSRDFPIGRFRVKLGHDSSDKPQPPPANRSVACAPLAQGTIGMTFCPGKWGASLYGGPWQRDLHVDVDAIRDWGASLALSLIEDHELALLRVQGLAKPSAGGGLPGTRSRSSTSGHRTTPFMRHGRAKALRR